MRRFLLGCACGLLLAATAAGQSAELGISGGYGILTDNSLSASELLDTAGQSEFSLSNGVRVGARMAFNTRAFTGHEVSYSYQHGGLQEAITGSEKADLGTVRAHHMYYNFVLHATPTEIPIRPFVTGGGGFSSFFLPGISSLSGGGDTKFGYNYGGGLKFNTFMYGLRLDVRNHVTGKPFRNYIPNIEGQLNNVEVSITFSLLL